MLRIRHYLFFFSLDYSIVHDTYIAIKLLPQVNKLKKKQTTTTKIPNSLSCHDKIMNFG